MSTQAVSAFLGGLGLFGIGVAVVFGVLTLVFLPLWALLDCAVSRRTFGEKTGIAVALLFTWGLGSVVYGVFFAHSRFLRFLTLTTVGGVLLVFVPSVAMLMASARTSAQATTQQPGTPPAPRDPFTPGVLSASEVGAFHAVHVTGSGLTPATAAVARFAGATLDAASARDVDRAIRHVVFDGRRYWGLTTHDFGAIDTTSGRFSRIAPTPGVGDFSWPKGIAFDASSHRVYIMASHVYTHFYRFDARASRWERLPSELRDLPIVGLAHRASDNVLYALEHRTGDRALYRLQRFNTEGASLGAVELRPPVPVSDGLDVRLQLVTAGDALVLLLSDDASSTPNRLLVIDPATGIIRVPTPAP